MEILGKNVDKSIFFNIYFSTGNFFIITYNFLKKSICHCSRRITSKVLREAKISFFAVRINQTAVKIKDKN